MAVVPLCLGVVLFMPMLGSENQFYVDWVNSYWLTLAADPAIWPLWFFGEVRELAALEPWYVYYGGVWFYLLGSLRELGLDPLFVYRASYLVLALGMSLGVYFLATRVGISSWKATLLACVALSFAYYLSNAYGRGAYTEFIFVSLIPIFAASCVYFFSADRFWTLSGTALMVTGAATLLLTIHIASLIITFDLVLFSIGLATLTFLFARRTLELARLRSYIAERWRRFVALGLLLLAAAVVASPQLAPAILTASGTLQGGADNSCLNTERSTFFEVFGFFPRASDFKGSPDLKVQTATWLVLWAGVSGLTTWRTLGERRKRVLILCLVLFGFCVAMTTSEALCSQLPTITTAFQFPYRFITYLNLSLLLICGVILSSRYMSYGHGIVRRGLLATFVLACIATVVGGIVQVRSAATYPNQTNLAKLNARSLPPTWYASGASYRQIGGVPKKLHKPNPLVHYQSSYNLIASVQCTGASQTVLNVADTRPLTRISGVSIVGSTGDGLLLADTSSCARGKILQFTVEQVSESGIYRFGTIMSFVVPIFLIVAAVRLGLGETRLQKS